MDVLSVVLVAFGVPLTPAILWAVPLLLIRLAFTTACALIGAAINVRFRDVKHALPLLLQVVFFATPIVYPFALVPHRWQPVAALNPLTGVVAGLRDTALHGRAPDGVVTLLSAAVAVGLLVFSYVLFTRADRRFADIV